MRIAVSGSHGSGKSTLIDHFLASHPEYLHEPEPYEWLVELRGEPMSEEPEAQDFYQQLEISAERLRDHPSGVHVIAERTPLDFLAYLLALRDLGRGGDPTSFIEPAVELARSTMEHIDVLVVLPLNDADGITVPDTEDPELRDGMNERLIDLIENDAFGLLTNDRLVVVELTGTPSDRLDGLEQAIEKQTIVEQISRVNDLASWDYTFSRVNEQTLMILGSNDFDYYHHLELELSGVTYCDLPDDFSHAEFRLLDHQRGQFEIGVSAVPKTDIKMHEYVIRASGISARVGTVYYYNRENLKPGERIASWVARDK